MGIDYVSVPVPYPDDYIYFTEELRVKLSSLWLSEEDIKTLHNSYYYTNVRIPSDLIISKTVPLQHFVLNFGGTETTIHTDLDDSDIAMIGDLGLMVYSLKENGGWEMRLLNINGLKVDDEDFVEDVREFAHILLEVWYSLQIALLHPEIKTVFQNPKREKIYTRQGSGKDRKRIVKYVRKHYITAEDIDEALYGHGHRDFERKTMAWYVIGHWRQYKNGTRKFINGYWKGPLREIKCNLDGGRVRQLAI